MSDAAKQDVGSPYRAGAPTIPPLAILYAPFSFFVLLYPLIFLVASVWITVGLLWEEALAAKVLERAIGFAGYTETT